MKQSRVKAERTLRLYCVRKEGRTLKEGIEPDRLSFIHRPSSFEAVPYTAVTHIPAAECVQVPVQRCRRQEGWRRDKEEEKS